MKNAFLALVLLIFVIGSILADDTVLSTNWKRIGGPYTSLVDALASPPVPVNVTTHYSSSEGRIVVVYNVHAGFLLRSEHSSTATQVQPGVLLQLANTNLTLDSAYGLTLTNSDYPLTSYGAAVVENGKSILISIYVEGPTDRSKLRFFEVFGGSETLCIDAVTKSGIYIAHISLSTLSCMKLDGPLAVGDCQSSRGSVQISPVASDGTEWFATACMDKCKGDSSHSVALFHHLSGVAHDTHGWIVAYSNSTSSIAISALSLADVSQNIRRVNLGLNYRFKSTTPSASSDVINVVSDPKAQEPVFKTFNQHIRGQGSILFLATLTGPFSASELETSAIRQLSSDNILSISTLHSIRGTQDALISGLIDAGATQAFVAVAAPPGLSSTFRAPPITTKSEDGDTHVLSLLSCQLVGHIAYLTFCAHGSKWTLGNVAPPAQSPVGGVFTVKLHLESTIMVDKSFLWQAGGLPLLAEDVVRVGRATLLPTHSPTGALVLSVDSDNVGIRQIMSTTVALPTSTFPSLSGLTPSDMSGHGSMGQASPAAAWSFVFGTFALTAVVGFFAWRYWRANGAEDWQKILEEEKRRKEAAF